MTTTYEIERRLLELRFKAAQRRNDTEAMRRLLAALEQHKREQTK